MNEEELFQVYKHVAHHSDRMLVVETNNITQLLSGSKKFVEFENLFKKMNCTEDEICGIIHFGNPKNTDSAFLVYRIQPSSFTILRLDEFGLIQGHMCGIIETSGAINFEIEDDQFSSHFPLVYYVLTHPELYTVERIAG